MFSILKFFYTCDLYPLLPSCMGNLSSFLTWISFSKGPRVYCRSLLNVLTWIFQVKIRQNSKLAADFNAECRMRLYLCLICQARAPLGIESAFWVTRENCQTTELPWWHWLSYFGWTSLLSQSRFVCLLSISEFIVAHLKVRNDSITCLSLYPQSLVHL